MWMADKITLLVRMKRGVDSCASQGEMSSNGKVFCVGNTKGMFP